MFVAPSEDARERLQNMSTDPAESAFVDSIDGTRKLESVLDWAPISVREARLLLVAMAEAGMIVPAKNPVRRPDQGNGGLQDRRERRPDPEEDRELRPPERRSYEELHALYEGMLILDHFDVLGVSEDASAVEVDRAYEARAREFHPDRFRRQTEQVRGMAARIFERLAEAYEVLGDPVRRRRYLSRIERERAEPPPAVVSHSPPAAAEQVYYAGVDHLRQRRYHEATEAFRRAVALAPQQPSYHGALGWAIYRCAPADPETRGRGAGVAAPGGGAGRRRPLGARLAGPLLRRDRPARSRRGRVRDRPAHQPRPDRRAGRAAPAAGRRVSAQPTIQAKAVWQNGKLVPFAEALTHVSAFGLHYGLGVFEGVRGYRRHDGRTAIFRLDEHITRLYQSAAACEMEVPFAPAVVKQACIETMRANDLDEGYLRPLVYTGAGALGMGARNNPIEVAVLAWPWSGVLGAQAADKGVRAHISSLIRAHVNSVMSKAKIVGAIHRQRAGQARVAAAGAGRGHHAGRRGPGDRGQRAERFRRVSGQQLFTPPLELSILAGITRDSVIALARDLGDPGGRALVHPGHAVHRQRDLPYRHRHRDHAGARAGRAAHRRRPARSGDTEDTASVLCGGTGPGRRPPRMADLPLIESLARKGLTALGGGFRLDSAFTLPSREVRIWPVRSSAVTAARTMQRGRRSVRTPASRWVRPRAPRRPC